MSAPPAPWTEERLLEVLHRHGAGSLERLRFRENRRTIWSVTGGGRRLNLHAAYRHAPADVVVHFAVLVRELLAGGRRGPAYRRAARTVRSWPGLRSGLERARRTAPRRRTGRRGRASRGPARPGPCCASPAQRRWLAGLYRHLALSRFGGDLPADVPVRLSRRMTSRLGHMRGDRAPAPRHGGGAAPRGRRRVVEIALSLDLMLPGNERELLDTLLHEMAHAADWLADGGRGHGPGWRRLARDVGCSERARCAGPLRRRAARAEAVTGVPDVAPGAFPDWITGRADG